MSKKVFLVVGKVPKWKIRTVLRFNRIRHIKVVRVKTARGAKRALRTNGSKRKHVRYVMISHRERADWPNAGLKLKNAYWHYIRPNGSVTN